VTNDSAHAGSVFQIRSKGRSWMNDGISKSKRNKYRWSECIEELNDPPKERLDPVWNVWGAVYEEFTISEGEREVFYIRFILGCVRKLHNEGLHSLYSFPSIITRRMIKSSGMRWVGHVARMGEKRI
jgi:hypothetical protein